MASIELNDCSGSVGLPVRTVFMRLGENLRPERRNPGPQTWEDPHPPEIVRSVS